MKKVRGLVESSEIYREDHLRLCLTVKGRTYKSMLTAGVQRVEGTRNYMKMPEALPRVDVGEEVILFFDDQKDLRERSFKGLQIIRSQKVVFSFSVGSSLGSEVVP